MVAVRNELKANNAYVAPDALQTLAESLDTSIYYSIEVVRDSQKAARILQLENISTEHSWAGSDSNEAEGTSVYGDVKFGERYFYEYSDNGDITEHREYETDGEFDMNKPFIVFIDRRVCDFYDDNNINEVSHKITIYSPETLFDEASYTAKKDAELAEICQLRA